MGTDRFFRPNYIANLTASWIPALDGVEPAAGGRPHRRHRLWLWRLDDHHGRRLPGVVVRRLRLAPAIDRGRPRGRRMQESRTAAASTLPQPPSIPAETTTWLPLRLPPRHGDPVGAAAHIRETLSDDGTCMLVEPFAEDRLENNLTPVGRIYAARPCCAPRFPRPTGRSGTRRAGRRIPAGGRARAAGFSQVRRAAETPFNLVLEARPRHRPHSPSG